MKVVDDSERMKEPHGRSDGLNVSLQRLQQNGRSDHINRVPHLDNQSGLRGVGI